LAPVAILPDDGVGVTDRRWAQHNFRVPECFERTRIKRGEVRVNGTILRVDARVTVAESRDTPGNGQKNEGEDKRHKNRHEDSNTDERTNTNVRTVQLRGGWSKSRRKRDSSLSELLRTSGT